MKLIVAVLSALLLVASTAPAVQASSAPPTSGPPTSASPTSAVRTTSGTAPSAPLEPLSALGTLAVQRTPDGPPVSGLTALDPTSLIRAAHRGPDGRTAVRAALLQARTAGLSGLGYVVPTTPQAQDGSSGTSGQAPVSGQVGVIGFAGTAGPTTVGVGDLDADGLDDLITITFDAGGASLTALRGTDGSPIWVAPQPAGLVGGFLRVIGDVDGDGRRDLMDVGFELLGASGSGGCNDQGCRDEFTESFRTTTTVIDGGSGAPLWTESVEGSIRQSSTSSGDGSSFEFRSEQSNVGIPHHPIGDVDGDGGADLVSVRTTTTSSDSSTEEGLFPGPQTTRQSRSTSGSSEVLLVDGSSGRAIRTIRDGSDPVVVALPVPDVDDDGVNDVLATRLRDGSFRRECTTLLVEVSCEESGVAPTAAVGVLGGIDLAPVWTLESPTPLLVAQAPADLTDDRAVDVLINQLSLDGDPDVPRLLAVDGRSGDVLWEVRSDEEEDGPFAALRTPLVLGATPLEDDGGIDLLAIEPVIEADDDGGFDIRSDVLRLDGQTGATLLRTEPDLGAEEDEVVLGLGGQVVHADADGSGDVLVQALLFDEEGRQRSVAVVEDGPTGEVRSTRTAPGYRVLRSIGDVDGDGDDEAAVDRLGFGTVTTGGTSSASGAGFQQDGSEEPASELAVVELGADAVVWSIPGPGVGFGTIRPAGRLEAGGEGIDVVIDTISILGDTIQTGVAARAGDDGRLLWSQPPPIAVRRVAGSTRTATAAALSADLRERAGTVVIARADLWPDAVTGAPLATVLDAPMLLAGRDQLGPDAREEVRRLGATRAVLLGGEAALSPALVAELSGLGLSVQRIGGADRFATAAAIARRVIGEGGDAGVVAIARGAHPDPDQGWSDAVTASAFAAGGGHPVLLALPDQLPQATAEVLTEIAPARTVIIGGPAALAGGVEQSIRALGPTTLRIAGFDRYSTARATAQLAVVEGRLPATAWVATGLRFPDALAASAAAGTRGVLLLTQGDPDDAAGQALSFVGANRTSVQEIVLIGGAGAIDPAVEDRLRAQTGP